MYPIRILHVLGRLDRGGAETMIMNMYRNIDRSKIQFDFVIHTNDKCDYSDEIIKLGGKIYNIPRYNARNHRLYVESWKVFFSEHPEYVTIHGHIRSTASIYLKIAKKNKLVTIAHSHNTSSGIGIMAIAKNIYQFPLKFISDYNFACSESAGRWLFGNKYIKKENFYILNNAINTNDFKYDEVVRSKKRKELNLEDNFVIGHVGRFHPQKNHLFILEMFSEIKMISKNAKLLLVGNGELKVECIRKAEQLGVSRDVIFLDGQAKIFETFQAMDVFVLPSLYEGLGIVAIEAQTSGLKCFVSDQVPEEAFITKCIEAISLDTSAKFWAEKIYKYKDGYLRNDNQQEIIHAGYDIGYTTKWIQEFYMEINR